jgi:uroporphyrinogen-III decarboxylase
MADDLLNSDLPILAPLDRIKRSFNGERVDRPAVIPKIGVDFGSRLLGLDLSEVLENPVLAACVKVRAAMDVGADAVGLSIFPFRFIHRENDDVFEMTKDGRKIGRIDMVGGLTTIVHDRKDFVLEDPIRMAYACHWHAHEPPVESLADVARIAVPDASVYDALGWGESLEKIRNRCGRKIALIADCCSPMTAFLVALRGQDRVMFDLNESPKLIHLLLDKGVAIAVEKAKYWIDHGLKIIRINDSAHFPHLLSKKQWRTYVAPRLKLFCQKVHAYDHDAKVICHICGDIFPILDDILDSRLDCIGPIDPHGGHSVREIRQEVGNDILLMGGIHTLSFVSSAPHAISDETKQAIREGGSDGRFIVSSGCLLPRTARADNIKACVDAAKSFAQPF